MPDITLILPTRNEVKTLGLVLDEVKLLPFPVNILVSDYLSTDGTRELAFERGVKLLVIKERGKGAAIREALKLVETPYVVTANSDHTYPTNAIITIYRFLRDYNYDVVIGERVLKEKDSMTNLNSLGNLGLSWIAACLYMKAPVDFNSGMWGFKTEILRSFDLTGEFFTIEADYFVNSVKHKCKTAKIPIAYRARPNGSKTKLRISDGFKIAGFLLSKRFSK